jgi:hypothetical protein
MFRSVEMFTFNVVDPQFAVAVSIAGFVDLEFPRRAGLAWFGF